MQRKYIYGFIALGFAISMELVLALYILKTKQAQPASIPLVSTIAIPKRGEQNNPQAGEISLLEGTTTPEVDDSSFYLDEEQDPSHGEEGPVDGYPAAGADATLDADHPLGSEPGDSEGSGWSVPDDSYPGPDNSNNYSPNPDYGADYPGPDGNNPVQPTPIPPSATPLPPTATQPAPTATPGQPTMTQAPQPSATATLAAATATPQATQAQATANPTAPSQAEAIALVSARAAKAPSLDGSAGDPAWADAQPVSVDTSGGANASATRVTVQSVYDDANVYFLLTWADPSQSFLLNPWEKQADGNWKRLVGAENKGSDENEYYQDKLALLWPINDSLPGFAPGKDGGRGCAGACHSGQEVQAKPLGFMSTGGAGQVADLWQLKSVTNDGQVDDGYLDSAAYSKDTPWAGLHSDPGKGGYRTNKTKDGSAPAYMPKGGGDKTGAPGYILETEKEDLAEQLFAAGERVPGILKSPFEGDRGEIRAAWRYKDGAWTLELARKRVTGSEFDVQFDSLEKSYFFALATFDNAQVRHAVQSGVIEFKFKK